MKIDTIRIKRGLNLPIHGEPAPEIDNGATIRSVALLGIDYPGVRPRFSVNPGDPVKAGQTLFTDRRDDRIRFTAPVAGTVAAIHRGEKRRFLSLVVAREGDDVVSFMSRLRDSVNHASRQEILALLLESGLFTAIRQRPFDRIPDPDRKPDAIFVPVMDTRPLSADPVPIISHQRRLFETGLTALKKLTDGPVHLCRAPGGGDIPGQNVPGIQTTTFHGPHPAGLAGTHIHFLRPVSREVLVWTMNYADVMEFGHILETGMPAPERIVSFCGPSASHPRLLRTLRGANLHDLLLNENLDMNTRVISGSVLYGHMAVEPVHFLGRHHLQVSVIPEGRDRRFLGWLFPSGSFFSIKRGPFARLLNRRRYHFTTHLHGSPRSMIPIGMYEKVMPLDILPTFLVRSMVAGDLEECEALGVLELGEEDMSLCTFVDPGKTDLSMLLRSTLNHIEREG